MGLPSLAMLWSISGVWHALPALAKARDLVRERVAAGLTRNILVTIRGGIYEQAAALDFGPQDSGTEKCSITDAAYPGERVVLSGGRRIAGWKKGEGGHLDRRVSGREGRQVVFPSTVRRRPARRPR